MIETFQAHSPKLWQSSQKWKNPSKGASEVRREETLERLQPSPCLGTPLCSIRRAAGGGQVIVSQVQHSYWSLDEHNLFTFKEPNKYGGSNPNPANTACAEHPRVLHKGSGGREGRLPIRRLVDWPPPPPVHVFKYWYWTSSWPSVSLR